MNYLLAAVLAFTLTAGVTFAQNNGAKGEPKLTQSVQKSEKNLDRGREKRRQVRLYSITFNRVVTRAMKLDLDDTQKEELRKINEQYLGPIVEKEKDLQSSRRTVMHSLTNPGFNEADVKKEFEKSQALRAEMFGEYVQGLNAVKEVVGDEDYSSLFPKRMTKQGKKGAHGKDKQKKEMKSEDGSKESSDKKDDKSE